jgi:uncharacterized protein (DUF1015 family)
MAEIAPFRGLRYQTEKLEDLAGLVIPPYDVISPEEQELFHQASPYNMIHLELGSKTSEDTEANNPHTRAAKYLLEWQREKVLVREEDPALYYYELDFPVTRELRQTRAGFMCALRLQDFSSGFVRPHEKTFQAVKDERLGLMLACQANLSPVFALYSDPAMVVDYTLKNGREPEPVISFVDRAGMKHRLWRVVHRETVQQVTALMLDKPIFIADGHHRYETALNYRNIQRRSQGNAPADAPFESIMMYLSNLDQGGLLILPTHRLLRRLGSWEPERFLGNASAYFEVIRYDTTAHGQLRWREDLDKGRTAGETVIGMHWREAESFYLMKAKQEVVSSYLAGRGVDEVLRSLDVVILDQLLLRRLLELPESFLANEHNIHFKQDLQEAVSAVQTGAYEIGFFINPTRIEQVQEVASAGLIMPHKATYFYPKVGSGLVIYPLGTP